MSKRADYWLEVSHMLRQVANQAPTDADNSRTLSLAYFALSLAQTADGPLVRVLSDDIQPKSGT